MDRSLLHLDWTITLVALLELRASGVARESNLAGREEGMMIMEPEE